MSPLQRHRPSTIPSLPYSSPLASSSSSRFVTALRRAQTTMADAARRSRPPTPSADEHNKGESVALVGEPSSSPRPCRHHHRLADRRGPGRGTSSRSSTGGPRASARALRSTQGAGQGDDGRRRARVAADSRSTPARRVGVSTNQAQVHRPRRAPFGRSSEYPPIEEHHLLVRRQHRERRCSRISPATSSRAAGGRSQHHDRPTRQTLPTGGRPCPSTTPATSNSHSAARVRRRPSAASQPGINVWNQIAGPVCHGAAGAALRRRRFFFCPHDGQSQRRLRQTRRLTSAEPSLPLNTSWLTLWPKRVETDELADLNNRPSAQSQDPPRMTSHRSVAGKSQREPARRRTPTSARTDLVGPTLAQRRLALERAPVPSTRLNLPARPTEGSNPSMSRPSRPARAIQMQDSKTECILPGHYQDEPSPGRY